MNMTSRIKREPLDLALSHDTVEDPIGVWTVVGWLLLLAGLGTTALAVFFDSSLVIDANAISGFSLALRPLFVLLIGLALALGGLIALIADSILNVVRHGLH